MIQRIQSLLLLGVTILLTVNLFVPIWTNNTGVPVVLNSFAIRIISPSELPGALAEKIVAQKSVYYIAILIIVCMILALYIIMQYKNRKLQIKLCNLLMLLTLMIIGSYFIAIPAAKKMMVIPADGNYEIGYFLPILNVLLILAARYYINKDEELVRSVDRIR